MKMKLGNAQKVNNMTYGGYQTLLKKELAALQEATEPINYILVSGKVLEWKDQSKSETAPLFYLGYTKDWITWAKSNKKLTLKDYAHPEGDFLSPPLPNSHI